MKNFARMPAAGSKGSSFLPGKYEWVLPFVIGLVASFAVLGWGITVPTNIAWLGSADPATYYLSWDFFRHAHWTLPPGSNPDYGMVGSSIFYGDAIPLVAIFVKVFSPWLPPVFQYLGLWLVLCFLLQAFFAWKLLDLLTNDTWIKALGTGLFVFAPPFLFRLQFHYSLCAQWLLLAALCLCLNPVRGHRRVLWALLGFLTAGIHSYIVVMIAALWLSDTVRRFLSREASAPTLAVDGLCFGGAVVAMLWLGGFFMVHHGYAASDLGSANLNLLALFNPRNALAAPKWSYLLPSLPSDKFDYEGFNFLGLGWFFLIGFCAVHFRRHREDFQVSKAFIPLLVALAGLTIFALSNHVSIGHVRLITYSLPNIVGALRGTGRMFWPVFYAGLFFVLRSLLARHPCRTVLVTLSIALALQVVDTSSAWLPLRHEKNKTFGSTWPTPLKSDFWTKAAARYHKVYLVPQLFFPEPIYRPLALYACDHGMATNAAYLARIDPYVMAARRQAIEDQLASGNYDPQALYILDPAHALVAAKSVRPGGDFLGTIDGLVVLAPGWNLPPAAGS